MEYKNKKSVNENLNVFIPGASPDCFIEVTEWTNGEGYDININDRQYSLSYEELNAINYLVKSLEYYNKN